MVLCFRRDGVWIPVIARLRAEALRRAITGMTELGRKKGVQYGSQNHSMSEMQK